jgi:hypothetical protein
VDGAKKKPRPKARQFIREETPRKGRGVSDASQLDLYGAPHKSTTEKSRVDAEKLRPTPFLKAFQSLKRMTTRGVIAAPHNDALVFQPISAA